MIKNISAFTAKDRLGRSIEDVLITPDKIVATDSFKLIELKVDTGITKDVLINLPKGLKTFDRVERHGTGANLYLKGAKYEITKTRDDKFPDYEKVIPQDKPVFEITLSAEHLKAICEAFEDKGTFNEMHLAFHGKHKAVVITSKKGDKRALLMPMMK